MAGAPLDTTEAQTDQSADATGDVAPVQPVQIELPTPPVQIEVAPTPPPEPAKPPPEPPPVVARPAQQAKPTEDERAERLESLEARLSEEVNALKEAREQLEMRERRERDRERLAYLRAIGASTMLSDEHILSLAPDIDPSASDGRAQLDKWREANQSLFVSREMTGVQMAEEVISNVPTSRHGTFGPRLAAKLARDAFGG